MPQRRLSHLCALIVLPLVCFWASGPSALAAEPDSTRTSPLDKVVGVAETILDWLTVERKNWSVAVYPAASYASRTGLAIGLMPMVQISNSNLPRPTTITPSFLVSTKRMFEVQCDFDIFLPHKIDITAKAEAYKLPDDFYAVGQAHRKTVLAHYLFSRRMLTIEASKGIGESGIRIGLVADADHYNFRDIEPTDSCHVSQTNRLMSDAGTSYGMGLLLGLDSRNDVLAPSNGWFVRAKFTGYAHAWGSDHEFAQISIDARRYWSLPLHSVFAAQATCTHSFGYAPFTKLPTFGGTRLGRAIGHSMKYTDNDAWLIQSEWRVPIYWRIGATIFGGLGNASNGIAKALHDAHLMAGGGLRFAVFPGKGLNVRLDAGLSNHGDHAFYFNIREAF